MMWGCRVGLEERGKVHHISTYDGDHVQCGLNGAFLYCPNKLDSAVEHHVLSN